jgi:DNA-binding transcriptional MerR regulator
MISVPELPDKLYFKIGEVARLVGVKPYVLRYWETEFRVLRPEKSQTRHRLYRRRDVATLLEIRRLLHDERYTIEGAKRRLRQGVDAEAQVAPPTEPAEVMARVRVELMDLCRLLERDPEAEQLPLVIGDRSPD